MNNDIKNFAINVIAGLFTAIVFLYLDKNGLTSLAYVVFGLYVLLIGLIAYKIFRVKKIIKPQADEIPDKTEEINKKENLEDQLNRSILLQILKMRSMNQTASPKNIASEMNQDASIVLAHLNKLHNEQYVTFITGGLAPTEETDFFLSPKAFEIINTKDEPPASKFMHFNDLLWLHGDPVPFCLRCSEGEQKTFHMFVKIEGNPPRYKCPHCGYYPKPSKHPDDPEDTTPPAPKQPLFMTRSGFVTRYKDNW
jgi:hypothetical protein